MNALCSIVSDYETMIGEKKLALRDDLSFHCVLVQAYLGGKRFHAKVMWVWREGKQ